MNEFGSYIRELRRRKNLSLKNVAEQGGISHSYLSQIENGKRGTPKPKMIKSLAKGLAMDYEELMFAAGYITGEDEKKIAHAIQNTHDQDLKDFIEGATMRKYSYEGMPLERGSSIFISEVMKIILEDALYIAEDADLKELIIDKEKQEDIKHLLKAILKK